MEICKRFLQAALFCALSKLSAQNAPIEMPRMPAMPDMPQVEMPSVGESAPRRPQKNSAAKKFPAQKDGQTAGAPNDETVSASPVAQSAPHNFSLQAQEAAAPQALSAIDLQSMSGAGLLGNIYSLLGANQAQRNFSASAGEDKKLQALLDELEKIKTSNADMLSKISAREERFAFKPAILRFRANGFDLLPSFSAVWFSEKTSDGSFLVTADRKYSAGGAPRSEIFYLLFKNSSGSGSRTNYDVEPELAQDSKNENSFLYKLASRENLVAHKTGNLVTFRVNDDSLSLDMLIDIGSD